ncbi:MAG: GDSL-type esterase/lipase family protein [Verrucomicrobiales bacterium]|jgi:lysophospholipase L1-like esterase|nr:GDSL-type esterase/lipase family protein [Verrucomicrobiales bacterium]
MRFFITTLSAAWLAAVTASGAILSGDKNLGSIWFLGDSIMQSNADGSGASSPRLSLYNQLSAAGYTFDYTGSHTANVDGLPVTGGTVINNLYHYHDGHSGWRIDDYTKGNANDVASLWNSGRLNFFKPNVIVIMLGTNDLDRFDYATMSAEAAAHEAKARMETLLNKIYALPNSGGPTVILSNIPPNGRTTEKSAGVNAFNALLPSLVSGYQAAGRSIYLADVNSLLNNEYSKAMVSDNLHTNAYGNDLLARGWFEAINAAVIPEPATWALLMTGAALLVTLRPRNKNTTAPRLSTPLPLVSSPAAGGGRCSIRV